VWSNYLNKFGSWPRHYKTSQVYFRDTRLNKKSFDTPTSSHAQTNTIEKSNISFFSGNKCIPRIGESGEEHNRWRSNHKISLFGTDFFNYIEYVSGRLLFSTWFLKFKYFLIIDLQTTRFCLVFWWKIHQFLNKEKWTTALQQNRRPFFFNKSDIPALPIMTHRVLFIEPWLMPMSHAGWFIVNLSKPDKSPLVIREIYL